MQLAERILLGTLTALIVARPLVAGDDPGRLRLTSGGGPLWLNLLTFLLLLGWAIWHGCSRRRLVIGPYLFVVGGALTIAICVFSSTAQPDRYQRPGWFIGWDWLGFAALTFVACQLATKPAIVRGLIGVLIATAGCLAVQALYDEAARASHGARTVRDSLPPRSVSPLVGDDPYDLKLNEPPPLRGTFRATLDQPDTLAGLVLIVIPVALVWAVAGWRKGGRGQWFALLSLLLFAALAMSLITWIVGTPIAGNGWRAACEMIRAWPVLGVGPGNFSRNAPSGVTSAGSFWLGFAATSGPLAMIVLALTLSAVVAVCSRGKRTIEDVEPTTSFSDLRWSFYFGGVAGLVLGMMLATGDLPVEASGSELIRIGAVSAGRALAWLLIFAALEMSSPSVRYLCFSLAYGMVLTALLGIVSDGLFSPALMASLLIAAGLALNRAQSPANAEAVSLPIAWIGAPVALSLFIANIMHVGLPGLVTASSIRDARESSRTFLQMDLQAEDPTNPDHIGALHRADNYLVVTITKPLKDAAKLDSGNSALFSELARWERRHVRYLFELTDYERGRQRAIEILRLDEAIARIDPRNPTPRFSEFEVTLLLIRGSVNATAAQLSQLNRLVGLIVEYDPRREVSMCYLVVRTLLTRRNLEVADPWAVRLLRLDAMPGEPHGKLTTLQRRHLLDQLQKIKEPSRELSELISRHR